MSGLRLGDAQRFDWLRLIRCGNVGPRTFRVLLNKFGGAGAALDALPGLIASGGGATAIKLATRAEIAQEIEAAGKLGVRFVALGEPDYPRALAEIDSAPPVLAVRGDMAILQRDAIAMVGSRNASAVGLAFTARLAREFGREAFAVVSGLARGIDRAAHDASLNTGTVAVLAGGHARVYPSEHEALVDDIIAAGGAVITEMPLAWEPRGRDFPRRNRLVSGLCQAVVVVEAARNSGSLITARFALEQGREVFAVPGSPLDPRAEGANELLREGASLCTRAEDVIDSMHASRRAPRTEPDLFGEAGAPGEPLWDEADLPGVAEISVPVLPPSLELEEPFHAVAAGGVAPSALRRAGRATLSEATDLAALLGPSPVSVDDLVRGARQPAGEVMRQLLELELSGKVQRQPNGYVSLK